MRTGERMIIRSIERSLILNCQAIVCFSSENAVLIITQAPDVQFRRWRMRWASCVIIEWRCIERTIEQALELSNGWTIYEALTISTSEQTTKQLMRVWLPMCAQRSIEATYRQPVSWRHKQSWSGSTWANECPMELVSKSGREKEYVRNASKATHMLSSLARCCHRQIRLGKGSPDVQQKGISGNTIFFAQPTADIPYMELPPPDDALVDSLNIVFIPESSFV